MAKLDITTQIGGIDKFLAELIEVSVDDYITVEEVRAKLLPSPRPLPLMRLSGVRSRVPTRCAPNEQGLRVW